MGLVPQGEEARGLAIAFRLRVDERDRKRRQAECTHTSCARSPQHALRRRLHSRTAVRVGQIPIEVALAGEDRAGVGPCVIEHTIDLLVARRKKRQGDPAS